MQKRENMFVHETEIRVLYSDTDQMGYMYYGDYAKYFEFARTESIRSMGLTYKELEDSGVMMPVLSMNTKYIGPAKYDDVLRIKTTIKTLPGTRIHFEYEVFNMEGKLINICDTTLVFVDMETRKPVACPSVLLTPLKSFF